MGFFGKVLAKGGAFFGQVASKVQSAGSSLAKVIDKSTTAISYTSSFFSDLITLAEPFIPELSAVNDLLIAIKDTSDVVNKMGRGGGFLDTLKEGTKNLISDEFSGNIPGYSQFKAGQDLLNKSKTFLNKRFSSGELELS